MKTYFDCLPCFVRHALDAARMVTDDEAVHERVLREVLRASASLDMSMSPPHMGREIHRIIRRETADPDPYREIKDASTRLALDLLPGLARRVEKSSDPFEAAVRFAVAGNIIDFGAQAHVSDETVLQAIEDAVKEPIDTAGVDTLRRAAGNAREILYLGDNAGEIVLDRLLIERLPGERVTFAVREAPVINDATIEDAHVSGLTDVVKVITNGSDAPGTILEECSAEFRERFERADVIIAKGQGNYETLNDTPGNIFFLLKAKCPVVARDLSCELGSIQVLAPRR
jgi:uncharacterized protein with ATP-grasp and redox domains